MSIAWREHNIGQVVEVIRNGLNVKQSDKKIGYPVTRIETISQGSIDLGKVKYAEISPADLGKYKLKNGDILFSHINSTEHIAKTAIYEGFPKTLVHGVNLLLLRPKKDMIIPKFLLYLLRTAYVRAYFRTRCKKAVNQSSLNQQDIQSVTIKIPPLDVQYSVLSILESCESAIKKRKEANYLTDEFLKSTFIEMFGDPIRNSKKWKSVQLGVALDVRDGTHDTPRYISAGIPLITSKNLKNGRIDFGNANYISLADYEQINKRSFVENGDILYGMIGTIGNPAIVDTNEKFSIKNVALFKFGNRRISNQYLKMLLHDDLLTKKLLSEKRGGNQNFVSLDILRSFEIPLPPYELQRRFADIVEKTEKIKQKQRESEKELNNLFNSLMQRAFMGRVENGGYFRGSYR